MNIFKVLLSLFILISCFESKKVATPKKEETNKKELQFMSTLDSCLCESDSNARDINHSKSLFITDQTLLTALDSSKYSFSNLLKNMNDPNLLIRSNGINPDEQFHLFIKRYLDNMILTDIPEDQKIEGELNDIQPLNTTHSTIVSRWEKSEVEQGQEQKFLEGSPYKLIAVVFRPDLIENDEAGNLEHAGEGRFIYQLLGEFNAPVSHFVILEYKLAMGDGSLRIGDSLNSVDAWDRKKWNEEWARLSCLEINSSEYRNQLEKVLDRVALVDYNDSKWSNKSSIGQVRVNDFINGFGSPWALFENQLEKGPGPNLLVRHRMENSPKDNFVTSPSGAVGLPIASLGKPMNPNGNKEIIDFVIAQKDKIADLNETYKLPDLLTGWQNTYSPNANWGREFNNGTPSFIPDGESIAIPFNNIDESIISNNEKTMIKYRFALNSCSSCHMDAFTSRNADFLPSFLDAGRALGFGDIPFSQNTLDENRPRSEGGFETIDIRGISTPFVHFSLNGSLSEFLKEDLIHRENELEFQLSVASCEEEEVEGEIIDIEAKVIPFGFESVEVLREIPFKVELTNVSSNQATSVTVNLSCPAGTEKIGNPAITAGIFSESDNLWVIGTIAPNTKESIELRCRINEDQEGQAIEFLVNEGDILTDQRDLNRSNENSSINLRIKEKQKESDIEVFSSINDSSPSEGDEVIITLGVVNKGPDKAGITSIVAFCPEDTSEIKRSVSVQSSKLWTLGSIDIDQGDRANAKIQEITCKINEGTSGQKLKFEVKQSQVFVTQNDNDRSNNSTVLEFVVKDKTNDKLVSDIKTSLEIINPQIKAGERIQLKLDIENLGPQIAQEIVYTVKCPEQLNTRPIVVAVNNGSVSTQGNDGQWKINNLNPQRSVTLSYSCVTPEAINDKLLKIKLEQSQLSLGENNVDNNISNHISGNKNIEVKGFRVCDFDLNQAAGTSINLSAVDIVLLQKHILGISLVGTPADNPNNEAHLINIFGGKMVDNSGDGRVSAVDLVNMRKWILGLFPSWEEAFKNNRKVDDCDVFLPFENLRFNGIKGN